MRGVGESKNEHVIDEAYFDPCKSSPGKRLDLI